MILKRPLTFTTPSLVNDTPGARAKVERDLREILRVAERYLGPQQIDQVVRDHRRARGGRTPDKPLNERLLAEYDVAAADGPWTFRNSLRSFAKLIASKVTKRSGSGWSVSAEPLLVSAVLVSIAARQPARPSSR